MGRFTRIFLPPCAQYDRVGMVQFLEEKARQGWMLDELDKFWLFRKTEPRALRFAVCWYPDTSAYDSGVAVKQWDYIELCTHSGWTLVGRADQLHIFCTDDPNATPIETDPELEVQTIHRAIKKRHLPLWMMWIGIGLLRLTSLLVGASVDLVGLLLSPNDLFLGLGYTVLMIADLKHMIRYFCWHNRALRIARDEGRFLPMGKSGKLGGRFELVILLTMMLAFLPVAAINGRKLVLFLLTLVLVGLVMVAFVKVVNAIRDAFAPKGKKIVQTILAVLGMLVALFAGVSVLLAVFPPESPAQESTAIICRHPGNFHEVYRDALPLYAEDLTGQEKQEDYSARYTMGVSGLAKRYHGEHIFCLEDTALEYTIIEVSPVALYKPCLRQCLDEGMQQTEAPQIPGVQTLYQLYIREFPQGKYVLQCDDRIICLTASWLLTEEQLLQAVEVLVNYPLPDS